MDNSKKIKSLSKKIAASLIKNEVSGDLEKSEIFDKQTKAQMLMDIKEGEHLNLLSQIDTEKDWKVLKKKIKRSGKSFNYWSYGVAASIVLLMAITFVFNRTDENIDSGESTIVNNNIEVGTDKATLTLADGSKVALEKGQDYQSNNITSNGEEIIYREANNQQPKTNSEIAYNTLTIPRGAQFYMVLSDGTKIWLNSESQLRYPVTFTNGALREVELVYGEAYFDVSPSTDHEGAKFKVFNKSQEIEVLGTEFNVKAYQDETHIYTTLVEGKVAVRTPKANQILLTPNQQLSLNLATNTTSIKTVHVYSEIAWKEGVFDFTKMPLKDITKVLSRWYDMEVVFADKHLESIIFTGELGKDQSIEDILLSLKSTHYINGYAINNKTLIIK